MPPNPAFPLLSALVLLPALGALIVGIMGRSRDALASWSAVVFAGSTLGVALWVLSRVDGGLVELYPWMPALGVSFVLECDGLSASLVVWVALATFLALVSTLPGLRSAVLVLSLETGVIGLFLAADAYVAFTFLGVALVVIALLSGVPRNVLAAATVGMTLLVGWFVVLYRMAFDQTGFASTALARWQSLVLYPSEERSLFLLGAFAIALLLPAFALAIDNAPRPHRLVLLAVAGLIESFLVLDLLVPICSRGAEACSGWVLAFAVALMALAALARGWTLMFLGYQGLVLFGLFSFDENVVIGAILMLVSAAVGFLGLALAPSRGLAWLFVSFLVGLPVGLILVPASRGDALWAVVGTLAFAAMGYRLVYLTRSGGLDSATAHETSAPARRARIAVGALAVLSSASMIFGWSTWVAYVRPSAASFIGSSVERDAQP